MPNYEFQLCHAGTGEVLGAVTIPLSVEQRDCVVLRRAPLPRSVAIAGAASDPGRQSSQVLQAYRRAEQRAGSTSDFFRRIGHTPAQVKKAWGT